MPARTFRINGSVTDTQTKKGISGLRVEVWNSPSDQHSVLGSAITDAQGQFDIAAVALHVRADFLERTAQARFQRHWVKTVDQQEPAHGVILQQTRNDIPSIDVALLHAGENAREAVAVECE